MKTTSSTISYNEQQMTQIISEWASVFMRHSMHDFISYTRSVDLSMVQMNVLLWLYHHSQTEVMRLEEVMQVSRPAASQMVERMVQQGLVTRNESPTDRRARLVDLSDHGRQLVEEALVARERWITDLMNSLPSDQKQTIAYTLDLLSKQANELSNSHPKVPKH